MSGRALAPRAAVTLAGALVTTLAAAPADAHLMNTGLGPFYDGLTHLFLTPEDLLPVVAVALLAGLRGPRPGRAVLLVLPAAWLVGSGAGLLGAPHVPLPAATAAVTIAIGALVAADRPLPLGLVAGLAILVGLVSGGFAGIELGRARMSGLGIAGAVCALLAVVSLLAGQVTSARAPWARAAVRIAGSWIAASGLLMLGWSVRGV